MVLVARLWLEESLQQTLPINNARVLDQRAIDLIVDKWTHPLRDFLSAAGNIPPFEITLLHKHISTPPNAHTNEARGGAFYMFINGVQELRQIALSSQLTGFMLMTEE